MNKSKLTETLRKLADGKTVYQAKKVEMNVRRVYQVKKTFDLNHYRKIVEKIL